MSQCIRNEGLYCPETSTIIAPAEIIEYCKSTRAKIDDALAKFSILEFDDQGTISDQTFTSLVQDEPEKNCISQLNALISQLQYPVESGLFERSNEVAIFEDRPEFTWEVLQKLYGTEFHSELSHALREFQSNQTVLSRNYLIEVLKVCKDDLENNIKRFGGDTEQRVAAVTSKLHLTTDEPEQQIELACNWHGEKFGVVEDDTLDEVTGDLKYEFKINNLNVLDFGCGDLRSARMFLGLNGQMDSYGKIHAFDLENLKGVDYSENSVIAARARKEKLMKEQGKGDLFNPQDIIVGDFFESQDFFEPESFHLVISLMRTVFHGITLKKLSKFLKAANRALVPGGVLLVDSVDIKPHYQSQKHERALLGDLTNMYGQFARRYKAKYQQYMPPGVDLEKSSRYAIEDNTAGNKIQSEDGFYPREVITADLLEYVIKTQGLDFDIQVIKRDSIWKELGDQPMMDEFIRLGRKWIKDNLLEQYYRREIVVRLDSGEIDQSILDIAGKNVEKILDYVAYQMVSSYSGEHIKFKKKKKPKPKSKSRLKTNKAPISPLSSRHQI